MDGCSRQAGEMMQRDEGAREWVDSNSTQGRQLACFRRS